MLATLGEGLHEAHHLLLEVLGRLVRLRHLVEGADELLLLDPYRVLLKVLLGELEEGAHGLGGDEGAGVSLGDAVECRVDLRHPPSRRLVQRFHLRLECVHGGLGLFGGGGGGGRLGGGLCCRLCCCLLLLHLLRRLLCGSRVPVELDVLRHLRHDGVGCVGDVHGITEALCEVFQRNLLRCGRQLHHHRDPHIEGVLGTLLGRQQLHEEGEQAFGTTLARLVQLRERRGELVDFGLRMPRALHLLLHNRYHLVVEVLVCVVRLHHLLEAFGKLNLAHKARLFLDVLRCELEEGEDHLGRHGRFSIMLCDLAEDRVHEIQPPTSDLVQRIDRLLVLVDDLLCIHVLWW
mmetsp:Transcript_68641/g.143234  ORF Transcript_68641/g.143234 Transcript_68641/m.143234 type:complete len:348 (-) Transcript_68641:389-1432(-)